MPRRGAGGKAPVALGTFFLPTICPRLARVSALVGAKGIAPAIGGLYLILILWR